MEKSVAEIVTEELCSIETKKNTRFRFLSGAIRGAGELNFSPKGFILEFRHKNKNFIGLIADMLEDIYGEKIPTDSVFLNLGYTQDEFFRIVIPKKQSADLLEKCHIVRNNYEIVTGIPKDFLSSNTQCKAFLRGLYLSCGFLRVPEKNDDGTGKKSGGYMMTFNLNSDIVTDDVIELIAKESLIDPSSVRRKKTGNGVYLRNSDAICSILTAMGCVKSVLTVYEIMAARQVVNNVNRIRNCDMANIDKTIRAGSKQIDSIKKLKARGEFERLTPELRETCRLRMEYPDIGIEELGSMFDPPVGKSCVNHRLRRIVALAEGNGKKEGNKKENRTEKP